MSYARFNSDPEKGEISEVSVYFDGSKWYIECADVLLLGGLHHEAKTLVELRDKLQMLRDKNIDVPESVFNRIEQEISTGVSAAGYKILPEKLGVVQT